jgi:hypothetical protein
MRYKKNINKVSPHAQILKLCESPPKICKNNACVSKLVLNYARSSGKQFHLNQCVPKIHHEKFRVIKACGEGASGHSNNINIM